MLIKSVSNKEIVEMFGNEFSYEANECRVLDALQMYLNGARIEEDFLEDLFYISFDECVDEEGVGYVAKEAVEDILKWFVSFNDMNAEDIFSLIYKD